MIIIHVSTQISWGGGEKQVLYLMKELHKFGTEQILVCAKNSSLSKKAKVLFSTVEIEKKFLSTIHWTQELLKLTRAHDDAILHAHDGMAHTAVYFHSLLSPNIPVIAHRRVIKNKLGYFSKLKYNHPSLKKIICISKAVRESLTSIVQDKNRLVLIPSGIKIEERNFDNKTEIKKEFGFNSSDELILNIGSLLEQKRQLFFLKIAKEYFNKFPNKRSKTHFLILGEGPLRQKLEEFIQKENLGKNCHLLGFTNRAQEILNSSDILVSTSVNEALGNVIMEAFLSKTAVIASDSGGVIDLIEAGKTGLLAKPLETESFVTSIERILGDATFKERIQLAGRHKLEEFNIENTSRDLYKVYLSLKKPD